MANLIATLPGVHRNELLSRIISHPLVNSVRINTGTPSPYSAYETLAMIMSKADQEKHVWVDLKCRQLRVERWCAPNYCEVELNFKIEVDLPARVYFRGGEWNEISAVNGNKIYLANPPKQAIGQGQSVNILSDSLNVLGYFTEKDLKYISAAEQLGIKHFMLSFYEGEEDIKMLKDKLENPNDVYIGLKIESKKGLQALDVLKRDAFEFSTFPCDQNLVIIVARDDLMTNIGDDKIKMLDVLEQCLEFDNYAIVASQFFSGLRAGEISSGDVSDLHLVHLMGYNHILLSDGICQKHFDEAISVWEHYREYFETK